MQDLLTVGTTHVWTEAGAARAFLLFQTGMSIDADGAPRAYSPNNEGLDHIGNAGRPGNWWALVTDTGESDGTPLVQQPGDPAPGFYISATSLQDRTRAKRDPLRYVDSSTIPYVVLPPEISRGQNMRLGDLAVVYHPARDRVCFAIFADGGPRGKLGEGSIALAEALGVPSSPRRGGTRQKEVAYLLFPGSGERRPLEAQEIAIRGAVLLEEYGGLDQLNEHLASITTRGDLDEEPWDPQAPRERPSLIELVGPEAAAQG